MKCPYCGKEMQKGYIQALSNILFVKEKHMMKMLPSHDGEFNLARLSMGISAARIVSFYCPDCDKIMIDGQDIVDRQKTPYDHMKFLKHKTCCTV